MSPPRAPVLAQRSPWIAALAFFLFGLGQVGALLHTGVRHERCAEHGELVEVAVGVAFSVAHDHGNNDLDRVDEATVAAADDHEHCALSLLPLAPHAGIVVTAVVDEAVAVVAGDVVGVPGDSVLPSLPALVNAPKTSPPGAQRPFLVSV